MEEESESFYAQSERAKSLERELEGCVLLCVCEFLAYGGPLFVDDAFLEVQPSALDS